MISAFLRSLGFHCRHRKISRVFFDKPTGQNYIICMDCCRRYVYDWRGTMQIKEPLAEPVTRHPVEEKHMGMFLSECHQMENNRVQEIRLELQAAYAQDVKEGQPDWCGVVYDAPRHTAVIERLKASGEWEAYCNARPEVFRTA